MEYQEFLDYIYQRHSGNVKLGLDRMLNILKAMDSPNEKLQGIHIAGTNGKGSTAAMCEALSMQFGIKTGLSRIEKNRNCKVIIVWSINYQVGTHTVWWMPLGGFQGLYSIFLRKRIVDSPDCIV